MRKWLMLLCAGLLACGGETSSGEDAVADTAAELKADVAVDTAPETSAEDVEEVRSWPWDDHRLNVMTFNVLCSFCNQDYDPWDDRLDYFADIFERHQPDLVGIQEPVFGAEVEQMLEKSPEYSALYFVADEPGPIALTEYPDATIFYRTERFEVIENGFYWLSETPDEPWSAGWAETNLPRLVAWAHLRQVSDGRDLYFASTHFDNNAPNQEMSAPLFVARSMDFAGTMPAILVGDFNSKPDSPAYAGLTIQEAAWPLTNAFDIAEAWRVETTTDPPPDYDPVHRIDHIFLAGDAPWACPDWVVDLQTYGPNDLYPSDHFAIGATINF